MRKVSMKWKNWSDSKGLHWMKSLVWTFFQDAEISTQWTIPHFQSTCVIPTSSNSWRNAKPFFWNAKPQKRIAMHLGHTWYIGKRSCNPAASSSAPYTQESTSSSSHISRTNSILTDGEEWRIMEQTNNDCRSQIFMSTIPTPATFAWRKMRFKTEVCTCAQFLAEAILWIKEVELFASVDDLKSSCGIHMLNSEVLDAKIASALNRIIHNSHFKKRINLEEQKAQKEDRFLGGKTDRLLDLRVFPGHWSQRFCRELCRPIYSCSSRWWYSEIRFKMGRIFSNQWRKSHLMTSWKDCTN